MGRFDALNQLDDEKKDTKPPAAKPASNQSHSRSKPIPSTQNTQSTVQKPAVNHDFMKTGNHELTPKTDIVLDKPQKYSTLLHTPIIRKIKVHSIENDMKDYEVIELALTEYFERQK